MLLFILKFLSLGAAVLCDDSKYLYPINPDTNRQFIMMVKIDMKPTLDKILDEIHYDVSNDVHTCYLSRSKASKFGYDCSPKKSKAFKFNLKKVFLSPPSEETPNVERGFYQLYSPDSNVLNLLVYKNRLDYFIGFMKHTESSLPSIIDYDRRYLTFCNTVLSFDNSNEMQTKMKNLRLDPNSTFSSIIISRTYTTHLDIAYGYGYTFLKSSFLTSSRSKSVPINFFALPERPKSEKDFDFFFGGADEVKRKLLSSTDKSDIVMLKAHLFFQYV